MKAREEKLKSIINWSENNKDVKVVLLTSSLVNPLAPVDEKIFNPGNVAENRANIFRK